MVRSVDLNSPVRSIIRPAADRALFLNIPSRVISAYGWRCHAYCLMANHFTCLIDRRLTFLFDCHDDVQFSAVT